MCFPDLGDSIDLTVSGHTHGGQIVPFGRPLIVPSRYGTRYAYGAFTEGRKADDRVGRSRQHDAALPHRAPA
jgi:predicted MPP superfamily phosphohydrolase